MIPINVVCAFGPVPCRSPTQTLCDFQKIKKEYRLNLLSLNFARITTQFE